MPREGSNRLNRYVYYNVIWEKRSGDIEYSSTGSEGTRRQQRGTSTIGSREGPKGTPPVDPRWRGKRKEERKKGKKSLTQEEVGEIRVTLYAGRRHDTRTKPQIIIVSGERILGFFAPE